MILPGRERPPADAGGRFAYHGVRARPVGVEEALDSTPSWTLLPDRLEALPPDGC